MSKHKRLISIGECLLELTKSKVNQFNLNFAGDSFNTAYYLAHLKDLSVYFASCIGTDPYSGAMREFMKDNDICTDYIFEDPDCLPGLYFIQNDSDGERHFYYYRAQSAAKTFFDDMDDRTITEIACFDILYTTGISLAIFNNREGFIRLLKQAQNQLLYFDNNFRDALWPDIQEAQEAFGQVHALVDTLFVTYEDEVALFSDTSIEETVRRYKACNIPLVVIKNGPNPCIVIQEGQVSHFETPRVSNIIDTTGAGDSFNAAFIKEIERGNSIDNAIEQAQRLSSIVIQHKGALLPKSELNIS